MATLMFNLKDMGVTIAHMSTDSIKIANATPEIIQYVMDFGKQYGYSFEHEATYSKMCIVNDAVYIAEEVEKDGEPCEPFWTATGKQFAVPYVYKTLFTGEEIEFDDVCETMSVKTAIYLGDDFIGTVGEFTPVVDNISGKDLLRISSKPVDGAFKYSAVTGSKGYKWMESEVIRTNHSNDWKKIIDWSYYDKLVNAARKAIEEYIPIDVFVGKEVI